MLEAKKWQHLKDAKALAYSCYQFYAQMPTGLSPEYLEYSEFADPYLPRTTRRVTFYGLRPEVAESLFVLHQVTGNPVYREWGWAMFQAINRYCRVEFGFAEFNDVSNVDSGTTDKQESYFLAETLKYLYLLQSPDHDISLEKYVFNTEAHPLRIFDAE